MQAARRVLTVFQFDG